MCCWLGTHPQGVCEGHVCGCKAWLCGGARYGVRLVCGEGVILCVQPAALGA
jgi:hypothetical protein